MNQRTVCAPLILRFSRRTDMHHALSGKMERVGCPADDKPTMNMLWQSVHTGHDAVGFA